MKYLIINADDFGMSKIFNESILDLIKNEKVKSTTVMVNRITDDQKEQVDELIELSKTKNLSVGLHLEFKNLDFKKQIKSQYNKFSKTFGFKPSHVDIHKASTLKDSISVVADFCAVEKIPCRNVGGIIKYFMTTNAPFFLGTTSDFSKIGAWLKTLKDGKYYEIVFHPGIFDPNCKSSLNKDREVDFKHVIKLNSILKKHNIKLISYLDFIPKS